jgi:predicted ABC-type ATPase
VGSNGAGKTTFFDAFLRHTGVSFVNADEIARALDLPGEDAYEAARLAAAVREDYLARRESFCMETVFSDPRGDKVEWLRRTREAGFRVLLIWVRLDSVELSIARVSQRVENGGHDVPDEKLVARFDRTLRNAREALTFADLGIVVDNSAVDRPFRHVETWRAGVRIDAAA